MIVNIYGLHFSSFDWNYKDNRLYCFDTFREEMKDHFGTYNRVSRVAALPDNSRYLMTLKNNERIVSMTRFMDEGQQAKAYESVSEVKI